MRKKTRVTESNTQEGARDTELEMEGLALEGQNKK